MKGVVQLDEHRCGGAARAGHKQLRTVGFAQDATVLGGARAFSKFCENTVSDCSSARPTVSGDGYASGYAADSFSESHPSEGRTTCSDFSYVANCREDTGYLGAGGECAQLRTEGAAPPPALLHVPCDTLYIGVRTGGMWASDTRKGACDT